MGLRSEMVTYMDNTILVAVISGLFGLISGGFGTYLGAILKYRKELESAFDREIRKERIRVYPKLWQLLDVFARYDAPAPLDATRLETISVSMRAWFFEDGGIFLSDRARDSYFALKKNLRFVVEASHKRGTSALQDDEVKQLIESASLLRAHLTKDLGTRRSPAVASD